VDCRFLISDAIDMCQCHNELCFDIIHYYGDEYIVHTYISNLESNNLWKVTRKTYKFLKEKYDPYNFSKCLGRLIDTKYLVNPNQFIFIHQF